MQGPQEEPDAGVNSGDERIGHYRVLAELGQDELGYFLGAVDERLDRMVVLRVSRPAEDLGDAAEEVWARMQEGARIVSHLDHPNLTTVYEYLPLHDADLVAVEQVEGDTLEELNLRGERFTVLDVARILVRIADALTAAHAQGLAHGRVGVANVKIRPDGRIKLLDLGLPREIGDDGKVVVPDPAGDIRGLAGLACELLAPPGAETLGWPAMLADATRARAAFGFLTPVLAKALPGPDETGFDSMEEFREAVLLGLESAAGRTVSGAGSGVEPSFSTRVIGPAGAAEEMLVGDRALGVFGRLPLAGRPTRLVLPPDLAGRVPTEVRRDPTVSPAVSPKALWLDRMRRRPAVLAFAVGIIRRRPTALAFAVVILALATVAVLQATRGDASEEFIDPGSASTAASDPVATTPGPAQPASRFVTADTSRTDAVSAQAAMARVRVTPTDATISMVGQPDSTWNDGDEVGVAPGDTILLEFARPGYVTERLPFTGSRVSVALVPDSVTALFQANVPADVFLVTSNGEVRLGTTNTARRLPSGTYQFRFRSPGQPVWTTTVALRTAGLTYRVAKMDYVTTGSLVAAVPQGWALASLDGGPQRETPATWTDIPIGQHVLRLERPGYETIVDTVTVPPGQVLRRQYTLRTGGF